MTGLWIAVLGTVLGAWSLALGVAVYFATTTTVQSRQARQAVEGATKRAETAEQMWAEWLTYAEGLEAELDTERKARRDADNRLKAVMEAVRMHPPKQTATKPATKPATTTPAVKTAVQLDSSKSVGDYSPDELVAGLIDMGGKGVTLTKVKALPDTMRVGKVIGRAKQGKL